jgi:hypothetical protein
MTSLRKYMGDLGMSKKEVKIRFKVKIGEVEHDMSMEELKALYEMLDDMFGSKTTTYIDTTYPWHWRGYPWYYCGSDNTSDIKLTSTYESTDSDNSLSISSYNT